MCLLDVRMNMIFSQPDRALSFRANHAPSCYNLAVMYKKGDVGIPPDEKRFEEFKDITNKLVEQYGGLKSIRVG